MTNGRFALEITSAANLVQDEQVRADSTLQGLAALEPILGLGTSITAGNASGLNDGACVLLLDSETAVQRWQLTPHARVLGMASAGVAPRTMGIGPVPAIEDCSRVLLARSNSLISSKSTKRLPRKCWR